MKAVDIDYLSGLLGPWAGGFDGDGRYPREAGQVTEQWVRILIRAELIPQIRWAFEHHLSGHEASVADALQWLILHGTSADHGDFFDRANPPMGMPEPPVLFWNWLWDELYRKPVPFVPANEFVMGERSGAVVMHRDMPLWMTVPELGGVARPRTRPGLRVDVGAMLDLLGRTSFDQLDDRQQILVESSLKWLILHGDAELQTRSAGHLGRSGGDPGEFLAEVYARHDSERLVWEPESGFEVVDPKIPLR